MSASIVARGPATVRMRFLPGLVGVTTTDGLIDAGAVGKQVVKAATAAAARSAIGLGNAATLNTGTASGTVAAGDDGRIVGAAQQAANLADLVSPAAARGNIGALGTTGDESATGTKTFEYFTGLKGIPKASFAACRSNGNFIVNTATATDGPFGVDGGTCSAVGTFENSGTGSLSVQCYFGPNKGRLATQEIVNNVVSPWVIGIDNGPRANFAACRSNGLFIVSTSTATDGPFGVDGGTCKVVSVFENPGTGSLYAECYYGPNKGRSATQSIVSNVADPWVLVVRPADVPALVKSYLAALPNSDAGLSVGDPYWNGDVLSRKAP